MTRMIHSVILGSAMRVTPVTEAQRLARSIAFLLAITLIAGSGCEEVANVKIIAPATLAGALVNVDGQSWGELTLQKGMATAVIAVSPQTRHTVTIEKPGVEPIAKTIEYEQSRAYELRISSDEVVIKR